MFGAYNVENNHDLPLTRLLHFTALTMYLLSFVLDLFDGMAARRFDQCSEFGGLLDMVTDRCSTLGLFFVLYGEYGSQSSYELWKVFRLVSLSILIFIP